MSAATVAALHDVIDDVRLLVQVRLAVEQRGDLQLDEFASILIHDMPPSRFASAAIGGRKSRS